MPAGHASGPRQEGGRWEPQDRGRLGRGVRQSFLGGLRPGTQGRIW